MLLGLGECSACLIQVGAFFFVPTSGSALAPGEPSQSWNTARRRRRTTPDRKSLRPGAARVTI